MRCNISKKILRWVVAPTLFIISSLIVLFSYNYRFFSYIQEAVLSTKGFDHEVIGELFDCQYIISPASSVKDLYYQHGRSDFAALFFWITADFKSDQAYIFCKDKKKSFAAHIIPKENDEWACNASDSVSGYCFLNENIVETKESVIFIVNEN
ncbi:hypothetical protein [Gallaecimonas sp. GXIMD4217]|uniref:hypothetical protein n=1 Tax=Gallaecimonas sp. GXIMD4217 TaxID=3131927 RepID=UPI00311B026E